MSHDGPPRGVLVDAEGSGGAFALMEYELAPRTLVAPLHTHAREDEYSYVLAGRLGAQIAKQTRQAGVGELLVKPRGVAHTLWNPGDTSARVLELIAPGGFERCLAALYEPGARLSANELRALWSAYGIDMDAGSLATLMSAHALERCSLSM